jgi:hypothetical protein
MESAVSAESEATDSADALSSSLPPPPQAVRAPINRRSAIFTCIRHMINLLHGKLALKVIDRERPWNLKPGARPGLYKILVI